METTLRIAQVTDIHIGGEDKSLHYDSVGEINVRAQFLHVMQQIKEYQPDLLVVSGDLASTAGEISAYLWIKKQLKDLTFPYVVMMGNHDCLDNLRSVFDIEHDIIEQTDAQDKLAFHRQIKQRSLLFLDTGDYQLDHQQCDWLEQQCHNESEILLFMHHPPILCGAYFMDERHSLSNINEAWSFLRGLSQVKHIFCGHYHTERILSLDNKHVYLTPSTMMQINTNNRNFSIEHIHPGWRKIEWDADDNVTTEVCYA